MNQPVVIGGAQDWESLDAPRLILESIFKDTDFNNVVLQQWQILRTRDNEGLMRLAGQFWVGLDVTKSNIFPLVAVAHAVLRKVDPTGTEAPDKLEALRQLTQRLKVEMTRYTAEMKPNPEAVFWPDPTREGNPGSVYDMLPYVRNHGLVTKQTPVGSAGSCFAVEIARNLYERGYNYVVTELFDNQKTDGTPHSVVYPGAEPDGRPLFSAGWGILFNSPSFAQIAERAFGEKKFAHLIMRMGKQPFFRDPFRESVVFRSPEAYEEDYEKHTAASREALMKSEVFILTMGLNEAWQYLPDGSFIHRNPNSPDLYPMLRHRTLTVEDNVRYIQRFLDLVRAHNPKFKLIISVSPIPFLATGRADEHHVISANTHSKAVQRVAAEILVENNRDVYYMPSYEMITTCIRDPWEDDQRHVKRSAVDRVMELFDKMFVAG